MTPGFGSQSMVTALRSVVVKRPEEAFRNAETIAQQWQRLGFTRTPELPRAVEEHRRFVEILKTAGADILYLPEDDRTTLDSLYAHDPVLITDAGAIVFQMGKAERRGEQPAIADALAHWGIPLLGSIGGDATAEAGDMIWLDQRTLLVGRGFRTNAAGIHALAELLRPLNVTVIPVHLPYWDGPAEVLHLMSFISLLDHDLAVVYRRLLPVTLLELLRERGVALVDVPEQEYASMGCNVLAVAPRRVLMVRGNPVTVERLQSAGCTVYEFDGAEICLPGAGGPTCLTRPVLRA